MVRPKCSRTLPTKAPPATRRIASAFCTTCRSSKRRAPRSAPDRFWCISATSRLLRTIGSIRASSPTSWPRQLGAAVFVLEHRYFGETMPFGNASFAQGNIQYLSAEQALADYAHFFTEFKHSLPYDCPVFVFGGSYGGMLTTWFRSKYPWIADRRFRGLGAARVPRHRRVRSLRLHGHLRGYLQ
jgi:pimeloyl-ACP methyl ester carboxylesterase